MGNALWVKVRRALVLLGLVGATVVVAACGSDDDNGSGDTATTTATAAAVACEGDPIVLTAITNISAPIQIQSPEFFAGIEGAAAAANKSCAAGAPLEIVTCDDKYDPNESAKCAREAVKRKSAGVLSYSGLGETYGPIVAKAGIPTLPVNATSAFENTNELSYPFGFPVTSVLQNVQTSAALGGKKLAIVSFALPAAEFFLELAKGFTEQYGMELVGDVKVPVTATDMTSFAAQAKATGADSIVVILGQVQAIPLFKALKDVGVDFKVTNVGASLLVMLPSAVEPLGDVANGLLANSWAVSPTDTSNPIIERYLSELKEADQKAGPTEVSMLGVSGWAMVHTLADALGSQKLPGTPENVAKALEAADVPTISAEYGLSPVDFSKPAFPDGELSKLRLFSTFQSVWEFDAEAKPQPLNDGNQVNVLDGKIELSRIGS